MKLKICGITNQEDALNAVSLGVDALGFIFYEHSPRYVDPKIVEEISYHLPPFVKTVGVFVNHESEFIEETRERCKLDLIQLHGDESAQFCLSMKQRCIKAIRVADPEDIESIRQYQGSVSGILLDTKVKDIPGGTGASFDWGLAINAKEFACPLILSGGINAQNIKKAMTLVNPYAIDICSGVEKEPGIKDYQKMQDLIQEVHS